MAQNSLMARTSNYHGELVVLNAINDAEAALMTAYLRTVISWQEYEQQYIALMDATEPEVPDAQALQAAQDCYQKTIALFNVEEPTQ